MNMRSLLILGLLGMTAVASGQFGPSTTTGIFAQLRPPESYLGVRIGDVNADRAKQANLPEEKGVEVASVEEGSPAAVAGIKAGDILIAYNGENVLGAQQFIRLVAETPQGRKVKIQLWREGRPQTVVVTTGAPHTREFAVPADFANFDMPNMRDFALTDIPDPVLVWRNQMLGMECEPLSQQLAQYFGVKGGVLVRSVQKGSPAEAAGLKAGDVISAIAGQPLLRAHDLGYYMRSHSMGEVVPLTVTRERRQMTLNVNPPVNREPSR